MRFEELSTHVSNIVRDIKLQLIEIDSLSTGTVKNSVFDLCILRAIGVKGRLAKAPRIHEVLWLPPPISWIKLNNDGAARGAHGLASIGDIFRDHFRSCLGCFAASIGIAYSLEAELHVVIHTVDLAWVLLVWSLIVAKVLTFIEAGTPGGGGCRSIKELALSNRSEQEESSLLVVNG
ncbi:uncharacterized protein LOC126599070 [Malus sylvestris]|uniref:uncharacterized protein LOC126599070 n=1 Tax=Malus sylvestris TaxID=3752 RepID=UPI0021ABEE8C|nr:uncharacterized protein LOC126599070 [Malus sylvestris]